MINKNIFGLEIHFYTIKLMKVEKQKFLLILKIQMSDLSQMPKLLVHMKEY